MLEGIDPKSLEIVKKIYLQGITRDKIKDEYDLGFRDLRKIERSVIKWLLLGLPD